MSNWIPSPDPEEEAKYKAIKQQETKKKANMQGLSHYHKKHKQKRQLSNQLSKMSAVPTVTPVPVANTETIPMHINSLLEANRILQEKRQA